MHHTISIDSLAQLMPGGFLAAPALWIRLIFAVAFVFAAIRLRGYRGPL